MHINVLIKGRNKSSRVAAMLDSGATASFISERFVSLNNVQKHQLPNEIRLHNIDGTKNKAGTLTHFAKLTLTVGRLVKQIEFLITDIGPEMLF